MAPSERGLNLWKAWETRPYPGDQLPPGSGAGTVTGVDLALAAGDAAAIFHDYFKDRRLSEDDRVMLDSLLNELPRAVSSLEGPARDYFEDALELLGLIQADLDERQRSWPPEPVIFDPTRRFPPLTPEQRSALAKVPATMDFPLEHRPCAVRLRDGRELHRAYVFYAPDYLHVWGSWPDDDDTPTFDVRQVVSIWDSPYRLPPALAQALYDHGETRMGGYDFTIIMRDGRRLACITGDAVDYPPLPAGTVGSDVIDVKIGRTDGVEAEVGPDYWRALYGDG